MSATNAFETNLLLLVFNNTAIAAIGDGAGLQPSGADGSLYVSLHTADPGEVAAGGQAQSECAYTSYARVAVARSVAGFTVAGNNVSNAALVPFPTATGGVEIATYFGFGTDAAGAGNLLLSGVLTTPIAISTGIKPTADIGELDVTAD